jgi:hypothetical protein
MTVDVGLPALLSCKLHAGGLARAGKRLGGLPITVERLRRRGRGIIAPLSSTQPSERGLLQTPLQIAPWAAEASRKRYNGWRRAREVRAGREDAMTT